MRGLFTTREQDGWRELINKEVSCRVNWKVKYGHKYPRQRPDNRIPRRKSLLPPISPTRKEKSFPSCEERSIPEQQQELPEAEAGLSLQEPLPEMRAPTPQTTQLLYQGISHDGKGRQHYLKERNTKGPEEKFLFPVLSSWEYGWRLGDVVQDLKTPVHGKSRIVKDTFYFRNGIFYHPSKTDKLS